jgi:sulfonate transport system substrate-binding protein
VSNPAKGNVMTPSPQSLQRLARVGPAIFGAILLLTSAFIAAGGAIAQQNEAELRVAWFRVGHTAPLYALPRFAEKRGLKINLIEFKRYADARTAIASGDLDLAAVGPQDVAFAVAAGSHDVIGIAGLATLGDCLVVRKGIDVKSWADFKGLRIAVGAGSIAWTKFVTALVENNVSYADVKVANISGGGANYIGAMQRGDVDGFVVWQPFCAEAVAKDIGYYPPTDLNATATIGGINSVVVANRKFLTDRPDAAQKLMDAYVEALEWVRSNPKEWATDYATYSGIDPSIATLALDGIHLDYALPETKIKQLTKFLFDKGVLTADVADQLFPAYFDYKLLAKSTGKTPSELGKQ